MNKPVNEKETDIIEWIISMQKGKYYPIDFTIENGFLEDFPETMGFYTEAPIKKIDLRHLPSQKPKILIECIEKFLKETNRQFLFSPETIKRIENEII